MQPAPEASSMTLHSLYLLAHHAMHMGCAQ